MIAGRIDRVDLPIKLANDAAEIRKQSLFERFVDQRESVLGGEDDVRED
jgi:hypothetical protein